jgi:hypothetical protein
MAHGMVQRTLDASVAFRPAQAPRVRFHVPRRRAYGLRNKSRACCATLARVLARAPPTFRKYGHPRTMRRKLSKMMRTAPKKRRTFAQLAFSRSAASFGTNIGGELLWP